MTQLIRAPGVLAAPALCEPIERRRPEQIAHAVRLVNLLGLAAWLGLATGLLELVILFARRRLIDSTAVSALELNQHALWMVPLSHCLLCGLCAVVSAAAIICTRWRWIATVAVYGLCYVAALSLLLAYRGLSTIAYVTLAGGVACQLARVALWQTRRPGRVAAGSLVFMVGVLGVLFSVNGRRERLAAHLLPPAPPARPTSCSSCSIPSVPRA